MIIILMRNIINLKEKRKMQTNCFKKLAKS